MVPPENLQIEPKHPGDRQVLAVEDDPLYQRLTRDLLRRAGIDCLPPVSTGTEAIAVAKRVDPAVILLDIELAGEMNGIEVAREAARVCSALMIFVSGHSNDRVVTQAKATFPYAYLTKPAEPRQLAALVHGAFRYRECMRAPAPANATTNDFITICAWCRSVRSETGWTPLAESFIQDPVKKLTHGVCPTCAQTMLES